MNSVFWVQLYGLCQHLGRFVLFSHHRQERSSQIGKTLVFTLAAPTATEIQRFFEIPSIPLVDGHQKGISVAGSGGCGLQLLVTHLDVSPRPIGKFDLIGVIHRPE